MKKNLTFKQAAGFFSVVAAFLYFTDKVHSDKKPEPIEKKILIEFDGIPVKGTTQDAKKAGFGNCKESGFSGIECSKSTTTKIADLSIETYKIYLDQQGNYQDIYIDIPNGTSASIESALEKAGWIGGIGRHTPYYRPELNIEIIVGNYSGGTQPIARISDADENNKQSALKDNAARSAAESKKQSILDQMNK